MLRGLRAKGGARILAEPSTTRTKEEDAALTRVGSTLRGKWRLDSLLGVGGVAAVYEATHRNGQRAALKVMHAELARDRSIVERFLREAYVANKVGHPACVRILDDDTTETEEPFLVMELLEGETVRDLWRRTGRTLPAAQALHIAERILDCLAACHSAGVVHRDLKPANIFLTRGGAVKLLDFGVAREEGSRHEGDKTVGLALGTPAYMSPEQANGQIDRIDGRSDLFSVGALLHALITGRRIHRGKTERESLLLAASEPVPSVVTIDTSLPAEIVRVIDRALAWEPKQRWPSAREMQTAVLNAMRVADATSRAAVPIDHEEEQELRELTPVHEVVGRDDPRVREVEALLLSCEGALVAGILHGFDSPSAEPAIRRAFEACVEIHRRRVSAISLTLRPFGFVAYDHVLWQPAKPIAAIPHRLFEGGVRAFRILPDLAFAELRTMLACIAAPGDVDVVGPLWEATLPHIRIDTCFVAGLGDIEAREQFATESLRDEREVSHRVHDARTAGAAWGDEISPLAPDDVIRAVYASQLSVGRWDERYAELYTDGLVQGARTRNVAGVLGALRKVAVDLYATRRYEDAATLRHALVERLGQRVGAKDAPKLAAAVTGAMLGKEALDTLLRSLADNPSDIARVAPQLAEIPPSEAQTIIAAAARPMPAEAQRLLADLVARTAGPAAAEAFEDRASAVPTWRNELGADAILPNDPSAERYARIVTSLAAILEGSVGHSEAASALARDLGEEAREKPFEIFFAEAVTFVRGRMLYADRIVHEAASKIASLLARCGAHAFVCKAPPTVEQLRTFAGVVVGALDRAAALPTVGPLALRAMTQAARTRGVVMERLALEPRVMRVRASAVAALRARGDAAELPRSVEHVARSVVDTIVMPGWLLCATTEPEQSSDVASRAVSASMLATAMARLLVDDRAQLVRVALGALTTPDTTGEDVLPRVAATLSMQTSGQVTAIARSVIAFEVTWLTRADRDGPTYRGARAATLHARIVALAHAYVALLADKGPPPPTPEKTIAALAQKVTDTADRTVLRLLVAALGFIPAGTVVRLSSGETAEVIAANRGSGRGPTARLVLDENGEEYSEPFEVEIAATGDEALRIEKVVSIEQWRKGEVLRTPKPMPVERRSIERDESEGNDQISGPRPSAAKPSTAPALREAPPNERQATATGTFDATPLVHTLVYMLDHGLTGTIELREPDGARHEIYFVRGGPVRARTGKLIAPLGSVLVAAGLLGDSDAATAVSNAQQEGVRLGEYLVSRDMIARVELLRALEQQVTRKVEGLVNLDGATTFSFFRDVDLFGEGSPEQLEVDPLGTVFAASRAWSDRVRIRRAVERAGGLLLAIHPDSTLELIDLTETERALVAELRVHSFQLAELLQSGLAPRDAIETFLFAAIVTRQLLVPGQAKAPMGVRPTSVRASPPSPFPASVAPSPAPPPSQRSVAPPTSMRSPAQKKISWSDLLAVRRPPSQTAMRAQQVPRAPPSSPAPMTTRTTPTPARPKQAITPAIKLTDSANEAIALMRRAEQALIHKDLEGAARSAARAVERDPNVPIVNAFYAWAHVLSGAIKPGDAIRLIDKALAQDPDCTQARLYRAKLLKRDDRLHEAIREFEVVLSMDPDNRDAQNELKLLLFTVKPGAR